MRQQILSAVIYLLSALIGVLAFAYPFLLPQVAAGEAHQNDAVVLTVILLVLCLSVLLIEVQGQTVSAKMVATLGVLVAVTSVLRFVEVAIPIPGGFSPIFAPIILVGFVFGARFGFLMGTLTLLASALMTGGVGPWLPYQMFTAGWVGLTAGWLPQPQNDKLTLGLLLSFGFVWGVVYGVIMNLYFWPYVAGDPATSWVYGAGLVDALKRYSAFYMLTSFGWDIARSGGNILLLLILGTPAIRALTRFRERFQFQYL